MENKLNTDAIDKVASDRDATAPKHPSKAIASDKVTDQHLSPETDVQPTSRSKEHIVKVVTGFATAIKKNKLHKELAAFQKQIHKETNLSLHGKIQDGLISEIDAGLKRERDNTMNTAMLMEMENRFIESGQTGQGKRNDLVRAVATDLKVTTWHDYLTMVGTNPSTYRNRKARLMATWAIKSVDEFAQGLLTSTTLAIAPTKKDDSTNTTKPIGSGKKPNGSNGEISKKLSEKLEKVVKQRLEEAKREMEKKEEEIAAREERIVDHEVLIDTILLDDTKQGEAKLADIKKQAEELRTADDNKAYQTVSRNAAKQGVGVWMVIDRHRHSGLIVTAIDETQARAWAQSKGIDKDTCSVTQFASAIIAEFYIDPTGRKILALEPGDENLPAWLPEQEPPQQHDLNA